MYLTAAELFLYATQLLSLYEENIQCSMLNVQRQFIHQLNNKDGENNAKCTLPCNFLNHTISLRNRFSKVSTIIAEV